MRWGVVLDDRNRAIARDVGKGYSAGRWVCVSVKLHFAVLGTNVMQLTGR